MVYKEEKITQLEERWLSDNLNATLQKLSTNVYPYIGGWGGGRGITTTNLGENVSYKVQKGKFVQVLNVQGSYWITVSNIMCSSGDSCLWN